MLKIGIDELATEKQVLIGYAFIILTEDASLKFSHLFAELKNTSGIKVFHGKKYKLNQRDGYKKFLEIIKSTIESDRSSLVCMTLNTSTTNDELTGFSERIFTETMSAVASLDEANLGTLKSFIPYLLSFQRICNHMEIGDEEASIEIDSDNIKKNLNKTVATLNGREYSGVWLIKTFCNLFKENRFVGAPSFNDSISAMSDGRSHLIQAADVFANFILAHIFTLAGHSSQRRKAKAELLSEVFGNSIEMPPELLNKIKLVGQSDS